MSKDFILTADDIHRNIEFWSKQLEEDYVATIQNLIVSRPFGDRKFYIQSFIKRVSDIDGVKKYWHHPRLTKPFPIPGHTLQKVDPDRPDQVTLLWTLPDEESFGLYGYQKIFGDNFVYDCIQQYKKDPWEMCKPDPDDLSDEQVKEIYLAIYKGGITRKK